MLLEYLNVLHLELLFYGVVCVRKPVTVTVTVTSNKCNPEAMTFTRPRLSTRTSRTRRQ